MAEKAKKEVSSFVIRRLPRYYRYLTDLMAEDVTRISSTELGKKMKLTPSQIRQDLNCFGGFGQQGYGYSIPVLHKAIGEILGVDHVYKTIIIGSGNLGRALANYGGFERRGFSLCGMFDNSEKIIGTTVCGLKVKSIDELESFCKTEKPDIAILTVPKRSAFDIASKICEYGISGIWNFSHMELNVPSNVCVENVHLGDSLMALSFNITKKTIKSE